MLVKIQSDKPVDGLTLKNIIDIFKVSKCPNESLFNSIKDFKYFDGNTVQIGNGKNFFEVINVEVT